MRVCVYRVVRCVPVSESKRRLGLVVTDTTLALRVWPSFASFCGRFASWGAKHDKTKQEQKHKHQSSTPLLFTRHEVLHVYAAV